MTADQLVHKGGLLGADTGLLGKQHAGAPRHKGRNKQRQRRYQHNPRRHKRIDGQHEHQRSEYGQDAGEQLGKPDEQSVRDLIRIGYDTADNIPHRTAVEIGQRKPLQMDKGILPQAAHHTERNMVVDDVHQPLAHRRHQNDDTGSHQNAGQPAVRIDLTLTDQQINGTSGQDGQVQRQHYDNRRKQQRQDKQHPIGSQIVQNLFHGRQRFSPVQLLLLSVCISLVHCASPPLNWDSWISRYSGQVSNSSVCVPMPAT